MKSVITVLAFFVFVSISFAQPHIEQGGTNPVPQTQTGWHRQAINAKTEMYIMNMYDRNVGWVGTGVLDSQGIGHAMPYKTYNGGETWTLTPIPEPPVTGIVYIFDDSNMYSSPFKGNSKAYKTSNGGSTWEEQEINMQSSVSNLIKLNQDTFIAHNGMNFTRTINGGKTWGLNGALILFNDMHFSDSRHGCVVGLKKLFPTNPNLPPAAGFMVTTNCGESWEEYYTGIEDEFWTVYQIDSNIIIAGGSEGRIGKSVDGGETWKLVETGSLEVFNDIMFPTRTTGYATASGGRIIKTTDQGESWIELQSTVRRTVDTNVNIALYSVYFIDSLTGWIGGRWGTILHTIDGGKLWVNNPPPVNNISVTTFPEPASQLVTLHYQLPNVQHVSISLYTLSGTKVLDVLINVIQHQGTFDIPINTTTLPSGIYLYRLDSEQYHATGNFTIIR